MHKSNPLITQHRRMLTRCAGLDPSIKDLVAEPLDCELSGDGGADRNDARHEEQDP
jgi:hypothetical protein